MSERHLIVRWLHGNGIFGSKWGVKCPARAELRTLSWVQNICWLSDFLPPYKAGFHTDVPIYILCYYFNSRTVCKSLVPSFVGRRVGARGRPPVGLRAAEDNPTAHHPTSVHYLLGQQTNTNFKSIPPENILQMFAIPPENILQMFAKTRNLAVWPMDLIQNGDGQIFFSSFHFWFILWCFCFFHKTRIIFKK